MFSAGPKVAPFPLFAQEPPLPVAIARGPAAKMTCVVYHQKKAEPEGPAVLGENITQHRHWIRNMAILATDSKHVNIYFLLHRV